MNVIIHRGGKQIGGSIVELSTPGCKVILDLGDELPGAVSHPRRELVDQVVAGADAILYSHSHADHVGLFQMVPKGIPQYIGPASKEMLLCTYRTLSRHSSQDEAIDSISAMHPYTANRPIDIGGKGLIIVTPYYVSHSVYDAYMFKVECEGKTILYTGDFRKHGYLGKGLARMLCTYVGQIDLLIVEGTLLGRTEAKILHEQEVRANITDALLRHKYTFALCASTNMERLASLQQACLDSGRVFVVDDYQAQLLKIFTKYTGPHFDFHAPFLLVNSRTPNVRRKLQCRGFLMPIRPSMGWRVREMCRTYRDEAPWLIYSMWQGYAEEGRSYTIPQIVQITQFFGDRVLCGTQDGVHTSGHADPATLEEVCRIVRPRIGIIPIHKDEHTHFSSLPACRAHQVFEMGVTRLPGLYLCIQ